MSEAWVTEDAEATGYPAPPRRSRPCPEDSAPPAFPVLVDLEDLRDLAVDAYEDSDLLELDTPPRRCEHNRRDERLMGGGTGFRCRALRRMAVEWYGPIPNVGQSVRTWRGAPHGWDYTPVRVDVVPVIHDRQRRGEQSARFAAGVRYYAARGADPRGPHWTIVSHRSGGDTARIAVGFADTFGATFHARFERGDDQGEAAHRARSMRRFMTTTRPTTAPPRPPP